MNEEKITTSDNKKLSPEEIKRVKGLGCLQDKRYDDIFNIRVITGNGHITTDEHRAIADAADKFGNGQITMTTRRVWKSREFLMIILRKQSPSLENTA